MARRWRNSSRSRAGQWVGHRFVSRGRGLLRLKGDEADEAWTLLTTLYELTGHEEPPRTRRPKGAEHGVHRDRHSWLERRESDARQLAARPGPRC